MLKHIVILFTFCCISAQTNKPVMLQLTPEQIRDTFDNVMSDEYIRILAKDFASKAAEHFVTEMRNQKDALAAKFGQIYRSPVSDKSNSPEMIARLQELQNVQAQELAEAQAQAKAQVQAQVQAQLEKQTQKKAEQKKNLEIKPKVQNSQLKLKKLLDSHEALNLLRDPEPDGDNLDSQSGELSVEVTRDKIPVIQVMKINGAYYRRLLGLI